VTAASVALVTAVLTGGNDDGDNAQDTTTSTSDNGRATTSTTTDRSSTTEDTDARQRGNFEDGFWVVGSEIQPGRYITRPQSSFCDWARYSDTRGDNVIISQQGRTSQVIVDILPTDKTFRSNGCGVWEIYQPHSAAPSTTIEEGDWIVGEQVEPGIYHTETGTFCSWERVVNFEHTAQVVIDSLPRAFHNGTLTVDVAAGEGFSTHDCGVWIKSA
jgi:hypothetical protein